MNEVNKSPYSTDVTNVTDLTDSTDVTDSTNITQLKKSNDKDKVID